MRSSSVDNTAQKKLLRILIVSVSAVVILSMLQDKVEAGFKNSAFYFSESFIFSSFWWLFIPLIYLQWNFFSKKESHHFSRLILLVAIPMVIHSILYPAVVWLASWLFYYHTFSFNQTLRFGLSNYGYQLFIFYTAPVLLFQLIRKREVIVSNKTMDVKSETVSSLLVSEGRKKINLPIASIAYINSSSPYISIHAGTKKFLSNETLKSVEEKLPSDQFIRIHKSTIVNIKMVASFQSRLNGDYDLCLQDSTILRVSRNYAADFKTRFRDGHRVTIE